MTVPGVGGAPLKFTPEELENKIKDFWVWIKKNEKPPTLERLYCFLECDKELLNQYEHRAEFAETVKKAKREILAGKVENLHVARNPAGTIFDLKNNHGWVDKQDISVDVKHVSFTGEDEIPD
jgi:hypothetical protein